MEQAEPIVLREYQEKAIENLRGSIRKGNKRIILQAPTGSGKTVIASEIIKRAKSKDSRVLFLCHRRELIFQTSDKLDKFGVPHGVILAGVPLEDWHGVQVASIQTLWSRAFQRKKMPLPEVEVAVIDECHQSLAKTWRRLIEELDTVTLGLTATPCRGDGAGLGHIYEDLVMTASVKELTEAGYLVPARYFAPSRPDLEGVRVARGDYVESDLACRMDRVELVGDIVETWGRECSDRQTIVFATGVRHSIHLRDRFLQAGVKAVHIDGGTPKGERDEAIRKFQEKEVQLITNVGVLTHGWDAPACACCVLARPTKSFGLYLQMAGRTLRPFPNKEDCVILDHSGSVYEHGFVDDPIPWSLNTEGKIQDALEKKYEAKGPVTCEKCSCVFSGQRYCPECGHINERKGRSWDTHEGELQEIGGPGSLQISRYDLYAELEWYRLSRQYKKGWSAHKYREYVGVWPPRSLQNLTPKPTSPEVCGWIQRQQKAWIRARRGGS